LTAAGDDPINGVGGVRTPTAPDGGADRPIKTRPIKTRKIKAHRIRLMKVCHYEQVERKPVDMQGATGCQVRWLVGQEDGAPNFAMRQFEVAAGGHTPEHAHPYEHEVFVLEGEGVVMEGPTAHPLQPGAVVFVPPNQVHQFRNTGPVPLKFLCLVPHPAPAPPVHVVPECGS
jgi:quercetin dioxygenase-like cupin family protein